MPRFLKLSTSAINVDCIRQVEFCLDPLVVTIIWISGCEATDYEGEDAWIISDFIDQNQLGSTGGSTFLMRD